MKIFLIDDSTKNGAAEFTGEHIHIHSDINGITELDKDAKSQLLHILFTDTVFSKVTHPLDVGLTMTTASLAKCFLETNKKIVYPLLE